MKKPSASKSFESAFLAHAALKQKIDGCSEQTLALCREELAQVIRDATQFSTRVKAQHLQALVGIRNVGGLQRFFYNYVLAAENLKRLR